MKETDRNYNLVKQIVDNALAFVEQKIQAGSEMTAEKKGFEHAHNADGWREVKKQIIYAAEHYDAYEIYKRRNRFTEEGLKKWASPYLW